MYLSSSKIHFDTMFVILCVIAGANSHTISSNSKSSTHPLSSHFRTSFMDFILGADLNELIQGLNSINKELAVTQSAPNHKRAQTSLDHQSQTICSILSHLLPNNHMKFCLKHQDILEAVLPEIIAIATRECARITSDLKWNCSKIDHLLHRSNPLVTPLAYTKEAALVRSIINASMMYLVARFCSEHTHRSCGCRSEPSYKSEANESRQARHVEDLDRKHQETINSASEINFDALFNRQNLSHTDLDKLQSGSPLRLSRPIIHRQDCQATIAFADAFTRIFMDSDDTRSLTKAYKVLNENRHLNSKRRLQDSDSKDLAFIKWTKSVVNLHNNNVGRQMVRGATLKRCRCHGLSGVCHFQTCWDQLIEFHIITTRLRSVYLSSTTQVEARNMGTYDTPDIHLTRQSDPITSGPSIGTVSEEEHMTQAPMGPRISRNTSFDEPETADHFGPGDLIFLHDSPDYCEPQANIGHPGTRGRNCILSTQTTTTSKKVTRDVSLIDGERDSGSPGFAYGTCESLCCNRGHNSELILDMVTCNCRFRFCCNVECDQCLKQREQHYCL